MADIKFTDEEKAVIVRRIQLYFTEELKQDLGRFDAEFLLEFFAEEVGAYFYNRGLNDSISMLEKPTAFRR